MGQPPSLRGRFRWTRRALFNLPEWLLNRSATARARFYKATIETHNCQIASALGNMGEITTVPLTKATRDRLRALGKKGETYDELLNRLMDVYVNRTVEFEAVG